MRALKRVNKTIRCCSLLVKMKWKKGKSLFFMDILIGLLREARMLTNMLFPAIIIQLILDRTSFDSVLLAVFFISLAGTVFSLGIEIIQRVLSDFSLRSLNYLILGLNQKAMQLDLETYEKSNSMCQFDKAYDALWRVDDVDFRIFSVIFSKLISLSVSAYIFWTVHWSIAVLVIATLFIEFAFNVRLAETLQKKEVLKSQKKHKKNYIEDVLLDYKSNKDIFQNEATGFFVAKYLDLAQEALSIEKEKNKQIYFYDLFFAAIGTIRQIGIYCVAVARYISGLLPISNFTLFTNAAKQMTYAIWQILQSCTYLFEASSYLEDYSEYMLIDSGRIVETGNREQNTDTCVKQIEFKNVSFRYPNQDSYALKNISFTINSGDTVALVGNNGAGKSTIVKLLLRLYRATEGEILINGKSIYKYSDSEYSRLFSPVFQDFMMYSLTIRENIAFDKSITDRELFDIVKSVDLDRKILQLTNGIDTPYTKRFGDLGVEFSGGEEQKVAIARAMATNASVIILDEPTSSLDPLAETAVYKLILELRGNKTTIFVSHRMSTTRFCRKILVFEDGALVEIGSHKELMQQNGLYQKMFDMQSCYYKNRSK